MRVMESAKQHKMSTHNQLIGERVGHTGRVHFFLHSPGRVHFFLHSPVYIYRVYKKNWTFFSLLHRPQIAPFRIGGNGGVSP
jgi:hypothetical protein